MMFWKRKKKESKENPLRDKAAGKIAGFFILLQTIFSNRMNKLFAKMSLKKTKIALIVFCFISGGLSIYFFVNAIVAKPKTKFKIDQVRMPQHFDRSGDEVMDNVLSEDIYKQIQDYKKYMDSTGETIRPGLQDSIRILEEIYLQQKK